MKLSRHVPVDHPLALQFQRAVESLTAAQVWDSARQYRGTARDFLIYLGDNHPDVSSLNQLRRDPHILGWFTHLRSLAPAVYISRLMRLRCIVTVKQLPPVERGEDWYEFEERAGPEPVSSATSVHDDLLNQGLLRGYKTPLASQSSGVKSLKTQVDNGS